VILVFDRLGLEAAATARQAALDFAQRRFPPRTWFAVYEIGNRVRVRQRITSDPAALVPAIEQATAGADRPREPGTTPEHATLTKEALSAALIASGDPTGTLALVMLHPENQSHFQWERKGSRNFSGHTGVELDGTEVVSPTLVRQLDGDDVTARLRVWIEEKTGRVLRTEARYRIVGRRGQPSASSVVNTQYRPEPSLALWVPEEMYERCEQSYGSPVEARARYSNHRRFQVETSEERARLAGEKAKP
jgi:hypothetical protein